MLKLISTHWGTYEVHRNNKNDIILKSWAKDPSPTDFGLGLIDAAKDKLRINQPYVRKGWMQNKNQSNNNRGRDEFIPVDWDTGLNLAAEALEITKSKYSNSSIFAGSYGWASAGRFHHAKSHINRFFNCFGGFSSSYQSYSYAAAQTLLPHVIGMDLYATLEDHTTWEELSKECELILMFGGMPLKNAKVSSGGVGKHSTEIGMKLCVNKGIKFINISPLKSDSPDFLNAKQIAIRPNTDTALMLCLAYILVVKEKYDKNFIEKYTVGFEEFKKYLLGKKNNPACTPEWCSSITDIPINVITKLAEEIISKKTLISMSWSLQRASRGEQPLWAGIALASMLGYIGTASGGFGFGYSAVNSTGDSFKKIPWQSLPQGENKVKDFIPVARITDMLEKPGEKFLYDGQELKYPDIKLIYWAGGNPFHHHQDLNRLVRAWQKPNTIIVNEIWWNAQARHADIIFPATTTLEKNDIMLNPRDPTIIANKKVMENFEQSKSDFEIFSGLSKKLGFEKEYTENKNEIDWLKFIWNKSKSICQENEIELPSFDEFWTNNYFELPKLNEKQIMLKQFCADPSLYPLNTPSGKIEIASSTISDFNLNDCLNHPSWFEPYEWLGNAKKYPLHLISNQPKFRLHGQLDNGKYSQNEKIKGKEPVLINPNDAKIRKINNGDVIRIFNDRGALLAGVKLTDEVMQGVIVLSTGAWFDPDKDISLERHGNPNVLTKDIGTSSLSQGPTAHTTLVEIKKADESILKEVEIFKLPNIIDNNA